MFFPFFLRLPGSLEGNITQKILQPDYLESNPLQNGNGGSYYLLFIWKGNTIG